jgi:hypothetical protein
MLSGAAGSHTEFEVIGNGKSNSFVGSGTLLNWNN